MAASRKNLFFAIRVTILLLLLVLAALGWHFVRDLGGPTQIIPELLRVHLERESASADAAQARINAAIAVLSAREQGVDAKVAAARKLAETGLERKKSYVANGLSLDYGYIGAQVRIANNDNTDLHAAASVLVTALRSENERLRLEASFALSNLQLAEQHANLVAELRRSLQNEFSVAIKTYLASTLGDIAAPAAPARDELTFLLFEDDPKLLASAARAFARIGPDAYGLRAEERLNVLLGHTSARVRANGAEALGAIGALSEDTNSALRIALSDSDAYVRVAAALGLADLAWTDSDVTNALSEGFSLAPRTTIFVEDVALMFETRARIEAYFASLGTVPDLLVPELLAMARQTQDIFDKEKLVAMLANTDEFSPVRVDALLDLLQDPKFGVYYAAVDGLVAMGPAVLPQLEPLLTHQRPQVRTLAEEVVRKLRPPVLKSAPVANDEMIPSFNAATDSFHRQEIAVEMAESGDPTMLQFLLDNRDVRVLNGPVYSVVVNQLVANLRQYQFSATHDQAAKRLALQSLGYLGVLNEAQLAEFLLISEDPKIGDQVRDIWYEIKRNTPRPPNSNVQNSGGKP